MRLLPEPENTLNPQAKPGVYISDENFSTEILSQEILGRPVFQRY